MVGGRDSMPRVKFAFSKDQLDAAPARTPTHGRRRRSPTRGAIVNGVLALNPSSEIPDADRFTPMGHFGIVPVRTGIVRLAFMKLLITLLLAALCAGFSPNKHVAFSCSLAAAVNLIAVVHYAFIWAIARAGAPRGVQRFAAKRGAYTRLVEGGDGPEPWETDDKRNLLMQEFAVDALRHSDWAVTLVFMTLDMWDLAEYANPPFDAAADGNVTACVAAHGADKRVGRPGVPGAQPPHLRRAAAAHRAVRHGAALLPRRAAAADRPQKDEPVGLPLPGRARPRLLGRRLCDLVHVQPRAVRSPLEGRADRRALLGRQLPDRHAIANTTSCGLASIWLQFGYPIVSAIEFAWVQAAARGWFKMTKVGADSVTPRRSRSPRTSSTGCSTC